MKKKQKEIQEPCRFVCVARRRNKTGLALKGMPEKMVDLSPSKSFTTDIDGERTKIWIVKIKGKKHKNAGTILDLPKKYQDVIKTAIKEGVTEIHGI